MFIPEGYMNVQIGMVAPNGRHALVSCGATAEGELSTAATAAFAAAQDSDYWTVVASASWHMTLARLVIGTSDPSAPIVFEASGDETGGGSSEGIQPATCLLVRKKTLLGGRAGRGRTFLPGLVEGGVSPAGFLTGDTAAVLAAGEAWWDEIISTGLDSTPVLLHTTDEHEPSVITAFEASSQVATQRRRLRP